MDNRENHEDKETEQCMRRGREGEEKKLITFGVYMWANPALAPFNVIPRIKKIVSTKYGNMDVKYTTFKSSRDISR